MCPDFSTNCTPVRGKKGSGAVNGSMAIFPASSRVPSYNIRMMLVLSSAINGLRNVSASYLSGQTELAMLDIGLTVTSVLWWREAKDDRLLTLDQLAIIATFSGHAYRVGQCHGVREVIRWIGPGASLVCTSYVVDVLAQQAMLSYAIWLVFHIVQTQQNVYYASEHCVQ